MKGEKNAAFTLIELLVVVLIVGILAAVAVPQYEAALLRSHYQQARLTAESIHQALNLYYLANGKYTINFDELDLSFPSKDIVMEENVQRKGFEWGYCHLRAYSPGNVQCSSSKARAGMEIFPDGRKYCYCSQDDEAAQRVCKTETGKSEGTPGATNAVYYSV